jgi:hypothetical protein
LEFVSSVDWIDAVHVSAFPPIRICVNQSVRFHRDSANDSSASVLSAGDVVSSRRHVVDNVLIAPEQKEKKKNFFFKEIFLFPLSFKMIFFFTDGKPFSYWKFIGNSW